MDSEGAKTKPSTSTQDAEKSEKQRQVQELTKIILALFLAAVAIFFLNEGLEFTRTHPNWLSLVGIAEDPNSATSMIFTPKKCVNAPWVADWANANNKNPADFPHNLEQVILQDYYSKKGISIAAVELQSGLNVSCSACGCKESYSLVVETKVKHQTDLILEGFEPLKGTALGFPFSNFRDVEIQKPSTIEECLAIPLNGSPVEQLLGSERDNCLLNLAQQKNDESACEKILSRAFHSNCVSEIAILNYNPTKCDTLSRSERDDCYLQVANALGRGELCERIDNSLLTVFCRISTRFGLSKAI